MNNLFSDIYRNKRILVTGHTGFKGSWLVYWLQKMGAEVFGYSLPSNTTPNHYTLLKPEISETLSDISNSKKLLQVFNTFKPEIVFHLAAQPLVRDSYELPVETFQTNIMGTVNILEAIRQVQCVKVAVIITSDKCYDNKEWVWGYRENDRLGGFDPYSASKACCELIISSYSKSFLNKRNILVASCRAGNVIGGGDWAKDRLFPDLMVSTVASKNITIRNPNSVRPWQHVLEPLSGYLLLGQRLLEDKKEFVGAWNFGPSSNECITVKGIIDYAIKYWKSIKVNISTDNEFHESGRLMLDCTKANEILNWHPVWDSAEIAVEKTVEWYKKYYYNNKELLTKVQLEGFVNQAKRNKIIWTL